MKQQRSFLCQSPALLPARLVCCQDPSSVCPALLRCSCSWLLPPSHSRGTSCSSLSSAEHPDLIPPDEEKGPGSVCRALHRLLEPKPSRASLEGICFNPCSSTSAPLTPAGLGGIWDSALPARLSRLFLDVVVYHSRFEEEKQNPATSKHRQVKCSA